MSSPYESPKSPLGIEARTRMSHAKALGVAVVAGAVCWFVLTVGLDLVFRYDLHLNCPQGGRCMLERYDRGYWFLFLATFVLPSGVSGYAIARLCESPVQLPLTAAATVGVVAIAFRAPDLRVALAIAAIFLTIMGALLGYFVEKRQDAAARSAERRAAERAWQNR